jgi:molecular chaperone GrpE (heat shock protein)
MKKKSRYGDDAKTNKDRNSGDNPGTEGTRADAERGRARGKVNESDTAGENPEKRDSEYASETAADIGGPYNTGSASNAGGTGNAGSTGNSTSNDNKAGAVANGDADCRGGEHSGVAGNGDASAADGGAARRDEGGALAELSSKLAQAESQSRDFLDRWQRSAAEFENYKRRTQSEFERLYTTSAAEIIAVFLPVIDSIERATGAADNMGDGVRPAANAGFGSDNAGLSENTAAGSDPKSDAGDGAASDAASKATVGATSGACSRKTGDPCSAAAISETRPDPYKEGLVLIERQIKDVLRKLDVKPLPGVGEQFDPNFHEAAMHVSDDAYGANEIVGEFQKGYIYKNRVVRHSIVKVAN